ncbi:hypothetical protein Cgig2_007804 [Carnegiea gigantea]|uniref:RNase H type-1 domain-containing protein n=1 Tax=Carnegiea gigantea TaxID=171969 RepID=A0A9Q1JND6_9CARY|nr:hypothetical protein Cgig2_007804 [Carnegiea gigantea]
MGSAIHDAMERLKLMAEEEELVEFEEDLDEEKADQIALSLIRKLYTTYSFNIGAIKSTLKNAWKLARELVIKEHDRNLFIFQFSCKADKEAVLNEGPWAFDGHTLPLKEVTGLERYSEVSSDTARFWVKVYDVAGLKRTKGFAECLANTIGKFVSVDEEHLVGFDKSLNFVADISIHKPLRRGIRVKVGNRSVWFNIRYVKLSDFCYACGMLGHIYRGYELYDETIPEANLPYGPNLWASPLKSKRRGWGIEKQEERMLAQAYKDAWKGKKAKMKLHLDNLEPNLLKLGENSEETGGDIVMAMNIDERETIKLGTEVFKRKSPEVVTEERRQGLGKPQAVKDLCTLIGVHEPSLVFLLETKLSSAEMGTVINQDSPARRRQEGSALRTCGRWMIEWRVPSPGFIKVNFDGAKIGESGHGLGMVARDCSGSIVMAAVQQGVGFQGPEYVEAMAYKWAMKQAPERGVLSIMVEGDSLSLMSKLKKKEHPNTVLGFLVQDILCLASSFSFCSFHHIRRVGNRVAHTLAHFQPYDLSLRVWQEEGPDCILNPVTDDLWTVVAT